jgi:MoaA/NifB/PqqE/SkfB family radical SAM enzyme
MTSKKENVFECSAVTKWLEIELTSYCWMKCIVCPRGELEKHTFLTFEHFRQIVALAKEWSYQEIMVCGLGDAFLHPQLEDFMEYLFNEIPTIRLFFMTKWLAITQKHFKSIKSLNDRWFNVSLTFSVFSLNEKMYNYLTWGNFYTTFMDKLKIANTMNINYSMEFMLSAITISELPKFKKFAEVLGKDYGISLVHNWWGRLSDKIHSMLFDDQKLKWYYIKRWKGDVCEVMKYGYLYFSSFGEVFQCSLNEIDRTGYLGMLGEDTLSWFLEKKNALAYNSICKSCFYFTYKTFN